MKRLKRNNVFMSAKNKLKKIELMKQVYQEVLT